MTINSEKEKNLETEIKIKLVDIAIKEMREKILNQKFTLVEKNSLEHNIVYDTKKNKLKKSGLLLRLRRKSGKNVLTLKAPSSKSKELGNYKVREETEVEVSDFENTAAIITALGFKVFFIYEKYREVYKNGNVKIMVDHTPIGDFLEIEGEAEEIDKTAAKLGFDKNDYITASYYSLFVKEHKSGYMQFK